MSKIRMEIKLTNGQDEHVMKFDERELKIMITGSMTARKNISQMKCPAH